MEKPKQNKIIGNNKENLSQTTRIITEENKLNIFLEYLKPNSQNFELLEFVKNLELKKSKLKSKIKSKLKAKQSFKELLLKKLLSKTNIKNNKNKPTLYIKIINKNRICNLNNHKALNKRNYQFDINVKSKILFEDDFESVLIDDEEEKEINNHLPFIDKYNNFISNIEVNFINNNDLNSKSKEIFANDFENLLIDEFVEDEINLRSINNFYEN